MLARKLNRMCISNKEFLTFAKLEWFLCLLIISSTVVSFKFWFKRNLKQFCVLVDEFFLIIMFSFTMVSLFVKKWPDSIPRRLTCSSYIFINILQVLSFYFLIKVLYLSLIFFYDKQFSLECHFRVCLSKSLRNLQLVWSMGLVTWTIPLAVVFGLIRDKNLPHKNFNNSYILLS